MRASVMTGRPVTAGARSSRWAVRAVLFAAWLATVLFEVSRHAFWRDEVRALSIALQGETVADMLRLLRGEGHPPVWYLMLRVAHDVSGSVLVLPVLAVAVAAGAALLLLRSPLPAWLCAGILFGEALLYEYSVLARNYGISVLLMFVIAMVYDRWRRSGVGLGVLLALLANTNAHCALFAGAYMLIWLLDLVRDGTLRWGAGLRAWFTGGCITGLGIVASFVSIYPPYNDAVSAGIEPVTAKILGFALLIPGSSMSAIVVHSPAHALGLGPFGEYPLSPVHLASSLLLLGAVLGLARWPAAMVAAAVSLLGLSVFFVTVYSGHYRHEALWAMFMTSLYWVALERGVGPEAGRMWAWRLGRVGFACFATMLLLQVPGGVRAVSDAAAGTHPLSRVRDFAAWLRTEPGLEGAIVIPEPDFMVEALPYYADNPIYLPRERRFARFSLFSSKVPRVISVGEILEEARDLCAREKRPVVMVFEADLETAPQPMRKAEGYVFELTGDAAQISALRAAAPYAGRWDGATENENFGAYVLRGPCAGR